MNKQSLLVFAALSAGLGLSACGGNSNSGNNGGELITTGTLRAVNGITDSTGLDVTVELSSPPPPPADPNLPPTDPPPPTLTPVTIDANNIPFGGASGMNTLPSAYYHVQVAPAGGQASSTDYVPINDNNVSTVFTYGTTATAGSFIVQQSLGLQLSNGQFALQFIHSAYAESQTGSPLCLQLTPAGSATAPPGSPLPLIAASFASATGGFNHTPSTVVAGGTYLIDAFACTQNPDGSYSGTGVILISHSPAGVVLPPVGTNTLQIAALDANASQTTQYGSPITLLLLDNTGKSTPLYNAQN